MAQTRVALVVPACQPSWEEIENLRGNLRGNREEIIQNDVSLGGSPTIKDTLAQTIPSKPLRSGHLFKVPYIEVKVEPNFDQLERK